MDAPHRPVHIAFVAKGLSRPAWARLKRDALALDSMGHRVTVISRQRRDRERVGRLFETCPVRVRLVHEKAPLRALVTGAVHVSLLLRSPVRYFALLRGMRSGARPETLQRFLHAGDLAHAIRQAGADHVHFLSENSRIARTAAGLAGVSYSVTARYRVDAAGREIRRMITPGHYADPQAVEALIRVTEGHDRRPERRRVLVVDCPEPLRDVLSPRLREEGLEVEEVWRIGSSLDGLLDGAPDVVISGPGEDPSGALRLLAQLRRDVALRQVPFVLLTDSDDRRTRIEALRSGADECLPATHDLEELVARTLNLLRRRPSGPRRDLGRRRRGVTGQLVDFPLPEIVQVLVLGGRSACVTLTDGGRQGRVWFSDGKLVHARAGDLVGEDAFFEILGWNDAEFTIEHRVETQRRSIEHDALYLVFEALRRRDEDAAAG